jgi:undecaprenyl-diphosphatase
LAAAAAALTALVAVHVAPLDAIDEYGVRDLHHYLRHHSGQLMDWKIITDLGGPATWRIMGAVAAIVLWVRRRRFDAVFIIVALGGAAALSAVVKALVGRPRPALSHPVAHAAGAAFPSGHMLTATVAAGLVIGLTWSSLGKIGRTGVAVAVVLSAGLIGFSRLMLGVHFPSDVVGGALLGAVWLAVLAAVCTWVRPPPATTMCVAGRQGALRQAIADGRQLAIESRDSARPSHIRRGGLAVAPLWSRGWRRLPADGGQPAVAYGDLLWDR